MTTTTIAPAVPAETDAPVDENPEQGLPDARPSRGLWRLQMAFLGLGLVIDFVAFSAALQLLDSQMVQWQAWLIAACGGALALFLMFEAGHLEARRRTATKGRHARGLIRVLIFVWLLAGVAATYIRVTTPPAGSSAGAFAPEAANVGWDLGLFTIYPDALPMALFMFVLYLGVGISAYIAGLRFEEHRQPSSWLSRRRERKALAAERKAKAAEQERLTEAEAAEEERLAQAKAAEEQAKAAEEDRLAQARAAELERLKRNLAAELERLERLHAERDSLSVRLAQLEAAHKECTRTEEPLEALLDLEAALVSLEDARVARHQRADEHLAAQQRAASLRFQLDELPGQIDREKRATQERGRYASEHARQVLSRGLGDPAKTVMGVDEAADEDSTDDPRNTR